MDTLDSDDTLLYSKRFSKHMEADIVQFVPFREFRNNPVQLARETLDEVPRQLLDYFKKQHITPLPNDRKTEIQQKLAADKNLGGFKKTEEGNEFSGFYAERKQKMLQEALKKGYSR